MKVKYEYEDGFKDIAVIQIHTLFDPNKNKRQYSIETIIEAIKMFNKSTNDIKL